MGDVAAPTDVWGDVIGQDRAISELTAAARQPVHAYLLVGPAGSGKRAAARAFAGLLLSAGSVGDDAERHLRLALAEAHPDLRVIEPSTATGRMDVDTARGIVKQAVLSPAEGARKVLVLEDFHLVDKFGAVLLKYVEEPPPSTFFVILAEDVPPELITIASRAVRVDFGPIPEALLAERLITEGVDPERARTVAAGAGGDLDRARLLATDDRFGVRVAALRAMPPRIDGSGARAAELAAEIKALIDDAQAAIDARQAAEIEVLNEQIKEMGERGSGKKELEDRHKREVRRHRTAELHLALATLAGVYRDVLATHPDPGRIVTGLRRIDEAALSLERFPSESLLLQSVLLHLPPL